MIVRSIEYEILPCQQAEYSDFVEDIPRPVELRHPQVHFLVHEQTADTRLRDKTGNLKRKTAINTNMHPLLPQF